MKKIKFFNLLVISLTIGIFLTGCKEENNNIDPVERVGTLTIKFNHYWNNDKITAANFNNDTFVNANNDILSLTKLRYLVSNINLHKSDGTSTKLTDYYLVDLEGVNAHASFTITDVPIKTYSSISFTFGFDEVNNNQNYLDLNSASWNWPDMLGGGYHFMQMEGKYGATGTENPFAYHMGTAKTPSGTFEQNYFDVTLDGFTTIENTTVEIKANIDQWFTNPNTWKLDIYNINLMPNYDAQIMMRQNGNSVFTLGAIN